MDMGKLDTYIGRFAPSPSGPLHFGSLLAAVASYLDAISNQGHWLIRVEDLDPSREPPGTAEIILSQLDDFGLTTDQPILYQSDRISAYSEALAKLESMSLIYRCTCSRQRLRALGGRYDGHCRDLQFPPEQDYAIRLQTKDVNIAFTDLIQGRFSQNINRETGDFVIKRRDGLFAYQLAVVIDDAFQQITHVIRGCDLLDSTPRQIYLQQLLHLPTPEYGHIPVAVNDQGQKLSKQHFAEPISGHNKMILLKDALTLLGVKPPHNWQFNSVSELLDWAIDHWSINTVPSVYDIPHCPSTG